ncbi:MAG: 30S ribosomal protein S20 [Planctomycetaceae bacterium]|jgi:small subunit ribosomal protein S20|nr:30S ribosomal protein S20 [Planctomycetaceae bacterium]|tara:strand:- start:14423 stop:14725 length:303 start_codon:yes stop_codon:yes gene_type:complete
MPNSASAKKRLRQNETRRQRNRVHRSDLRTSLRRVLEAIEAYQAARAEDGDADAALATVNSAYIVAQKKLDKAGSKNLIHRNKAARTKSRLQARIKKAKA